MIFSFLHLLFCFIILQAIFVSIVWLFTAVKSAPPSGWLLLGEGSVQEYFLAGGGQSQFQLEKSSNVLFLAHSVPTIYDSNVLPKSIWSFFLVSFPFFRTFSAPFASFTKDWRRLYKIEFDELKIRVKESRKFS